ncbi:MAG: ornithine cyclodeaminase family protein [Thermoplasmatales archaeon]
MTKLLSNADIKKVLNPNLVLDAVEKTWIEYARGRVINPAKLSLDLGESGNWPNYNAYMNAMPSYVGWLDVAGLKWAGGFWNNIDMPSISAMILLIDPKNGIFKSVMEGAEITAQRTAAQSVIGIKYLARKKSETVGIFGAGFQARNHIIMISSRFPSLSFRIYDPKEGVARKLKEDLSGQIKNNIQIVNEPQQCADSDIVITLTSSRSPFFKPEWVRKGMLLMLLGSYQEALPETFFKVDKIIGDHIEQIMHRGALKNLVASGKIKESDIYGTIGEIASNIKTGRASEDEKIIFIPIGTGMLDVAVAELVYREAVSQKIGSEFEFVHKS